MHRFVRLAALYEDQVYQESKISWTPDTEADPTGLLGSGSVFSDDATKQRELAANASRIEGWRQTLSYKYFQRVSGLIYVTSRLTDYTVRGVGLPNMAARTWIKEHRYLPTTRQT